MWFGVRVSVALAAFEGHAAALVHPDADAEARDRHRRFLVTRLIAGLIALAALPIYLVLWGSPSPLAALAFGGLVMPLLAAVVLSRTGRLDWAHGISSGALALLVSALACASGGAASPVLPWLVAVPLEALLSGSRSALAIATLLSLAAAAAIAVLDGLGAVTTASPWEPILAMPIFGATALAYAAAIGLDACRVEAQRAAAGAARQGLDRLMLDSVDDLLTCHDRFGAVLFASAAAERLLGVAGRALHGEGLFERVHVADRPAYLKAMSEVANGAGPLSVAFRLNAGPVRPGATCVETLPASVSRVVWVEMRLHRVTPAGRPGADSHAVAAVLRDITHRVRHEEELDSAKRLAEEANVSKGRFLATVSHELRTPLNAIIGFSEILAAGGTALDDPRRTEYARIINVSGQHLNEVVGALLDISKMETGNFDFRPEPFDAVQLAHGCCDLMQLKAAGARLALERDIAGTVPEIIADRRGLKQMLLNLLSNAVKFTPPGGRVTVGLRHDGQALVLRVADTGIGIAECDFPKLGSPFFQARSSYDRPYEGTGLGLSIVRGLVALHHGTMVVESALAEGTAVTITLPGDCQRARAASREPFTIETVSRRQVVGEIEKEAVRRRA